VLVATRAVHVTVLEFLGAGFPHLSDFHLKIQSHASKRMISIQAHLTIFDTHDGHHVYASLALGLKLHARLNVDVFG